MIDPIKSDDDPEEMFYELNKFTSHVQQEIAVALCKNPNNKKQTTKWLAKPDHEIMDMISLAIKQVVLIMPLASNYGVNVFTSLLAMHSTVTKDKTIENLLNLVKNKIESEN